MATIYDQHELFLNHFEVNAYWLRHSVNIHLDSHHTDDIIIFFNNHCYYLYFLASEACIICTCFFLHVLIYICLAIFLHLFLFHHTCICHTGNILKFPSYNNLLWVIFLHVLSYCESWCLFAPIATTTEVTFQP